MVKTCKELPGCSDKLEGIYTFPDLIDNKQISEEEIQRLLDFDYCKATFNVNYPVIKKIDLSKSIKENRYEGNYTRYYAFTIEIYGNICLLTSEWYEWNKQYYIQWLEKIQNISI